MGDLTLTYEQLFDTLRREKSRDELQVLEPGFYAAAREFLASKQEESVAQSKEGLGLAAQRAQIEHQNARRILKELYERRERKIVTLAMHKTRTDAVVVDSEALLPDERALFDTLVDLLISARRRIVTIPSEPAEPARPRPSYLPPAAQEPRERTGAREAHAAEVEDGDTVSEPAEEAEISVVFLSEVPKFVGKDLKVFGPYMQGERAEVPESVARILVRKGRAQETG